MTFITKNSEQIGNTLDPGVNAPMSLENFDSGESGKSGNSGEFGDSGEYGNSGEFGDSGESGDFGKSGTKLQQSTPK